MIATLLLAAATILPADRMAVADRLFNRGRYAEAATEYEALAACEGIAQDELMFRRAECARATGHNDDARKLYSDLVLKYPESSHANRARFMYAMGASEAERPKLLAALDTDRVDTETRAAALYHLGLATSSLAAFERCVRIAPKGRYADYANLRVGTTLAASSLSGERRRGVEVLLGLAFGGGKLADEALYLAAIQSYRGKKYGEAASLFRRYRRNHPKGEHFDECGTMAVWSDFMEGRYSDAEVACGEAKTDDLAYIRASCAYALGDNEKALKLFRKYLEDFPQGKYRTDAELPIARIEFDTAQKTGDGARTIETAKRGFGLSKLAADELRLAWSYEKAGKDEAAREEYSALVKNFPGTEEAAEALYRRALIDVRAESWSSVELTLAEALATKKILKFKASALYWRGVAAMKLKHEAEAVGFLTDALGLGLGLDESREARLMVADYNLRAGKVAEAKAAYSKLVSEGACARMSASRIHSVGKLFVQDASASSTNALEVARTCAHALVKSDSAEWRQAGWTLLGDADERAESYTAAVEDYRKAMAEPVRTVEVAFAALHLGLLEARLGEHAKAEETLKRAVSLNGDSPEARAHAYLALARNAEARGDAKTACAYATVVSSLFDDEKFVSEAKRILAAHPEEAE